MGVWQVSGCCTNYAKCILEACPDEYSLSIHPQPHPHPYPHSQAESEPQSRHQLLIMSHLKRNEREPMWFFVCHIILINFLITHLNCTLVVYLFAFLQINANAFTFLFRIDEFVSLFECMMMMGHMSSFCAGTVFISQVEGTLD